MVQCVHVKGAVSWTWISLFVAAAAAAAAAAAGWCIFFATARKYTAMPGSSWLAWPKSFFYSQQEGGSFAFINEAAAARKL